jgi:hypothetical protein
MGSVNARAVAHEVVEMVGKGLKVNYRSLLLKHGYSKSVANKSNKVTKTKSYMDIVNPAMKKIENIHMKSLQALEKKNLDKEKYRDLVFGVDILTKNIQLLSGKSTDNVAIQVSISEQIGNKYAEVSSDNAEKPSQ